MRPLLGEELSMRGWEGVSCSCVQGCGLGFRGLGFRV